MTADAIPDPPDFDKYLQPHPFEADPLSLEGDCAFCGLSHPDYGLNTEPAFPDPPAPPDDLGAPDDHVAVRCPECGSGVGYPCHGPRGTFYAGHRARREAAKRVAS